MVDTMAEVGRHCRSVRAVSQATQTVPQIGVIFSRESIYKTANRLFGGWGKDANPTRGWLDLVLGCQWSADVIPDWKLKRVASQYPCLILPEWDEPGEATRATLLEYVRAGGRLLVAGARNAARWAADCGVHAVGEPADQPAFLVGGVPANVKGVWQHIEPGAARVLALRYPAVDARHEGKPAAVSARVGKGEVVLVPGPVGVMYATTHAASVRRFGQALVAPLFEPLVRVEAPPTVEVVLRRKAGRLLVHLLNTTNMQVAGEYATTDYVPAVGPVHVTLGKTRPKEVRQMPAGLALTPVLKNGQWVVEIDRLALHEVISVVG
jgi:hypothetical protein